MKIKKLNKTQILAGLLALFVAISATLLALTLVFALRQNKTRDNNNNLLENTYKRNFYDLCDTMQQVELKLDKLTLVKGANLQSELAEKLWKDTATATVYLDGLPIKNDKLSETTRLVNIVGDYAYVCTRKIVRRAPMNGDNTGSSGLTADELNKLTTLHERTKNINKKLESFKREMGNFKFLDNLDEKKLETDKTSLGYSIVSANTNDLPSLVYDGPFSDALANPDFSHLKTYALLSVEEATTKASEYFGKVKYIEQQKSKKNTDNSDDKDKDKNNSKKDANKNDNKDTDKNKNPDENTDKEKSPSDDANELYGIDCYYFETENDGAVTLSQHGGLPICFSSGVSSKSSVLQADEAKKKAEEFVKKVYKHDFEAVWAAHENNIIMINLAQIEKNNDSKSIANLAKQIKIKMNLADGKILGLDALTYISNMAKKPGVLTPQISTETAKNIINPLLNAKYSRTVIIPLESGLQRLAYEFECSRNETQYLSYVDCTTADELDLKRIVDTDMGELVM